MAVKALTLLYVCKFYQLISLCICILFFQLHIANTSNEDLKCKNSNLVKKLETAMQKLVSQQENESKLHDTFEQELQAQKHLAQIYKG